MEKALGFRTFRGERIREVADRLAALRIAVFRDYPYLYEGTVAYEKGYLETYAAARSSFLFTVWDGPELVGATTCIPLADETDEVKEPFLRSGVDPATVCYFGESVLLQPYRGLGLGHRFFDEREAYAREAGTFRYSSFCAVERPADHPMRPAGYRPNDALWLKRGYKKVPELQTTFDWPDLGDTVSTAKPMIFWMREL